LYYPDQVVLLSTDGRVLREYWHSGVLTQIALADVDGDGKNEIVLGGVNNGYRAATLIVLDPGGFSGASVEAVLPFTVKPNRNIWIDHTAKLAYTRVQYAPDMVCNQNEPPFFGSVNVWKSISPWYKVVFAPPSVMTPPGSSDVGDVLLTKRVKRKQNSGLVSWFPLHSFCQQHISYV